MKEKGKKVGRTREEGRRGGGREKRERKKKKLRKKKARVTVSQTGLTTPRRT